MKNGHAVCAILLVALMAAPVGNVLAQGSLGPPGPPGSTMVTLQQLWDKIDQTQAQLTDLDAGVGALSNRVSGLEADLANLTTQVQSLVQAQFSAGASLMITTVSTNGTYGEASLAFSPVGSDSAICYYDESVGQLKDARGGVMGWTTFPGPVQTAEVCQGISAGFNSNGEYMVAYYAVGVASDSNILKLARYDLGWTTEIVDTNAVTTGDSLAFDMLKRPAVSYFALDAGSSSNGHLRYAGYDGSKWVLYTVDDDGDVGDGSSLAFIGWLPAISYFDRSNGRVKYAKWTGAAWTTEVVAPVGTSESCTSLEFAPDGNPAISFYDSSGGDLKFAKWTGAAWDIQTVDSAGDVGVRCCLEYAPDGYPAIAYCDMGNGDLKYAKWIGSSWDVRTVDALSMGMVGYHLSFGFTPSGRAAVAYKDMVHGLLKYVELPAY